MNKKLTVVVLVLAIAFPAVSIYALQNRDPNVEPSGPEYGRDEAITYILQHYEEFRELGIPASWKKTDVTPDGWVGSNEIHYMGGGWFVRVSNAVVLKPDYTVSLEYNGDVIFHWEGTVDQDGNVVEVEFARGYPVN